MSQDLRLLWRSDPLQGRVNTMSYRPHPGAAPRVPSMVNIGFTLNSSWPNNFGTLTQQSPEAGIPQRQLNLSKNAFPVDIVTDPWFGWTYNTVQVYNKGSAVYYVFELDVVNSNLFAMELPPHSVPHITAVRPVRSATQCRHARPRNPQQSASHMSHPRAGVAAHCSCHRVHRCPGELQGLWWPR